MELGILTFRDLRADPLAGGLAGMRDMAPKVRLKRLGVRVRLAHVLTW